MAQADSLMQMEMSTQANGCTVKPQEMEHSVTPKARIMLESFQMMNNTDKALKSGTIANSNIQATL